MAALIRHLPADGAITNNQVILRTEHTLGGLRAPVALRCENVGARHPQTGPIGVFATRDNGRVSSAGSTTGQAVGSSNKDREAMIVTNWNSFLDHECSHRSDAFQPLFRDVSQLCEHGKEEIACKLLWPGVADTPAEARAARDVKRRYGGAG